MRGEIMKIEAELQGITRTGKGAVPRKLLILSIGLAILTLSGCVSQIDREERAKELDQASARRDVGIDFLSNGKNAVALREFMFAEEINPDDAETMLWMGEAYRRQGHNDEALEYMLRAIDLQPSYQNAHQNISAFYLQIEDYEHAIHHAEILVADPLNTNPWTAYSNLGWAQYKLGEIKKARDNFQMALDFRRGFWPASLNLGILEGEAGHNLKAIEHFERVIQHGVGGAPNSEANFRVAEVYVSMGHRKKALRYFDAATKSEPDGTWADQSRKYISLLE
jgi:type IV pilus assembly protein PilF